MILGHVGRALADHRARRLRRRRHHARPRSSCARCARSAPTSTGTCRAGSTTATASRPPPSSGSPRAARSCWSRSTARSPRSRRSPPRARAGMDVVVTDHHAPRADGALPDAPIVHPRIGGYPCPDLCAAGVAYKLAQALMAGAGEDPGAVDEDLDLVALATVADVVSLTGENRRLVRAGLRAPRRHAQAGPAGADGRRARRPQRRRRERDRLPPRARGSTRPAGSTAPTPASSCCSPRTASAPARSPPSSTRSTPSAATSRPASASRPRRCWPSRARRGAPAHVLAAEGWHPGVIGIVAAAHRRAPLPPDAS